DYRLPQAAFTLQAKLGSKAQVIQLDSACSGFVDGLLVASGLLDTRRYETALVVGADTSTRLCDPKVFMPLTIFGDGAAAVVLHQASVNILCALARRLELEMTKFVVTYPHTGNLMAASIPVALDQARRDGKFQDGDWLVMPAVGAGMAWGAVTYQWYDYLQHRAD